MHQTWTLLRKYRDDIDSATESIQGAPEGPVGFPTSEWKNILGGRTINLDIVHSNIHTFRPVQESVGRLGPFEIRTETSESPKRIQTAAQWISAWDESTQATEVAFPHCAAKLRDYGRGVRKLFDAIAVSYHQRVFAYDKAVRGCVRGGETLSLTDDHAFQHLYTAYILPVGAEVQSGGRSQKRDAKEQLCRSFNGKGCSFRGCRFKHNCGICNSSAHGGMECPKGKPGNDNKA